MTGIERIGIGILSDDSILKRIKDLVAEGWDVNQKDEFGCRPLMRAESPKVAKALIASGADINAVDYHGNTALKWARVNGNEDVVAVLIAAGAKVRQ